MSAQFPIGRRVVLESLGGIVLRHGDNDSGKIWGGFPRRNMDGNPVKELQEALIAIGVLLFSADGKFGTHTQQALRRFQWYARRQRYLLRKNPGSPVVSGTIAPYTGSDLGTPGACDARCGAELTSWRSGNFLTTTPLVRLSVTKLSNVELADSFKILSYPSASDDEVLVHSDFADEVRGTMNDQAKKFKVTLRVNQTFRVHGVPPSGTVVTPATRSQHLVGHAVDLNIVDGATVNTSSMFNAGTETDNADKFIDAVKKDGLRWGGDFQTVDPPHFDDFLNSGSEDYDMTFFFAQTCFDRHHPMRLLR